MLKPMWNCSGASQVSTLRFDTPAHIHIPKCFNLSYYSPHPVLLYFNKILRLEDGVRMAICTYKDRSRSFDLSTERTDRQVALQRHTVHLGIIADSQQLAMQLVLDIIHKFQAPAVVLVWPAEPLQNLCTQP